MLGEFINDRLLPDFVQKACIEANIVLTRYSDDWILRLEKDALTRWIVGYTFDINSASSVAIANDKVACYEVLAHNHIPSVEHYLARLRGNGEFLNKNLATLAPSAACVVKPLSASSGSGVNPFACLRNAQKHIMAQPTGDWAISPRYTIQRELRYYLLDDELLLAYEKHHPTNNLGLPMYNLGQGATAAIIKPEQSILTLAISARKSIGLRLCAVDIAQLDSETYKIMEINSGIMIEHFARQSTTYYDVAYQTYKKIIDSFYEK